MPTLVGRTTTSRSRQDVEALQRRRRSRHGALLYRIDPRAGHAVAQPFAHLRHLLRRPLKHRLDRTIPAVANPAGNATCPRVPHAAVAEADALDDAAHPHQAVSDLYVL